MTGFSRTFPGIVALALLLAACSGRDDSGATPTDQPATSTATAASTTPVPSGTPQALSPGLQKLLDDVASVRELPAPPNLEVNLVARSQLAPLLDSLLTDEDREWFHNTTTLYRLLGHFRDDQDYETVYKSFGTDSVLGLYSPLDDALWIVHDDGETLDLENLPSGHKTTLAHEFVHAIQDYNFKLDEIYSRTVDDLDWGMAYTSAVEGDAVTHERAYTKKFAFRIGGGPVVYAAGDPQALLAADVPASIQRELFFPYTTGVEWVGEIKQSQGVAKVNEIIKDPPRGSTYALHPELLASGFRPADVRLPDIAPALGAGWKRESGGQFGEFQVRNYLQLRIRAGAASDAAKGWQGDRYDVYVNGSESVATFRVRFASDDEAQQFVDAQEDMLTAAGGKADSSSSSTLYSTNDGNTTATVERVGAEVLFVIGSSRGVAEKAIQAIVNG